MSEKIGDGPGTTEEQNSEYFTNENGYQIWCKYWSRHLNEPRALLFICHGAGEHLKYYDEIAQVLTQEGLYAFGHDHEGHGHSEGTRMHITDMRHYVRDIFKHIERVKTKFPHLPVFILGHSMGGLLTVLASLDRPDFFTGFIVIGPALIAEHDSVGPIRIFIGKILSYLFPLLPLLWLDSKGISRDEAMCRMCDEDPLNYNGGMRVGWGLCILNALKEIESKLDTISGPFLALHGEKDIICNVKSSQTLYDNACSKDKTLKIMKDCYHNLLHEIEPEKTECINEIVIWLKAHM